MAPVTVVIPAHHADSTIQLCVDAACRSTIRDRLQLTVVDDGGNSQLARRLASYPVTIVTTGGAGSAAYARDLGVRHRESEIVVFLDADVIVESDAIEKLVQPIECGLAHATVGNYSRRLQGLNFAQSYKQLYVSLIYSRRDGYITNEFWTALGAVRTSVYHAVGGLNLSFKGATGEDVDFGIRLTRGQYRILQTAKAAGQHRHPFTLVTLLKNDFHKGLNLSRNLLSGLTRMRGNRHSSLRDVWAVVLSSLLAVVVPVALLPSPAQGMASLVALCLVSVYATVRGDLLRILWEPGFGFFVRSLPVMYVLDLVRASCVATSLLVVHGRWRQRRPISGKQSSSTPPMCSTTRLTEGTSHGNSVAGEPSETSGSDLRPTHARVW